MFDFGRITELLIIAVAALVLIGPKELPRVLYTLGRWLRKFQGLKESLKQSVEPYIREGEADEYYRHINHTVLNQPPIAPAAPEPKSAHSPLSPPPPPDSKLS